MARIVNISEAKAQLSRLVAEVQDGKRVIIARAGRPVAVLSAYDADPEPRALGGWTGQVWMADAFHDPLPTSSGACSTPVSPEPAARHTRPA